MSDGDIAFFELLPASARDTVRWQNGRGVTQEVAVGLTEPSAPESAGGFDWRVSIASVDGDVDFSAYPGVDRYLMALTPAGLDLVVDGEAVGIRQFWVHRFEGESVVASVNVTEPAQDLNLMLTRSRAAGELTALILDGTLTIESGPEEVVLVIVLDGAARLGEVLLGAQDAVRLANGARCELSGVANLAIARIRASSSLNPVIEPVEIPRADP
ncbi:HutD family protein [Leifsonia sp. YAF41]|uniref:HutD/Ves family protein n=1 Tax=Leifsonia sp. YAF41 TaxID=3233086 RepID=UPI003F9A9752